MKTDANHDELWQVKRRPVEVLIHTGFELRRARARLRRGHSGINSGSRYYGVTRLQPRRYEYLYVERNNGAESRRMPIVTLEADGRPARARKEVQRLHERAIEASRRVALVQAAEREHEERLHELRAEFEALSAGEPGGGAARREWNLSVRVAGTAMRSQGGILARAIAAARAAELDASTAALQLKRAEEAEAALAHEAAVNRVKYEAAGARRADLERRAAARWFCRDRGRHSDRGASGVERWERERARGPSRAVASRADLSARSRRLEAARRRA